MSIKIDGVFKIIGRFIRNTAWKSQFSHFSLEFLSIFDMLRDNEIEPIFRFPFQEKPMSETTPATVECKAARDPLLRLGFATIMLVGFGLYCVYDIAKGTYPYMAIDKDFNTWATWAFNFYGQFVFTAGGLFFAWKFFKAKARVLVADDDGVGYVGGTKIAWSAVTQIDLSKFKSKEIMVLHTADDEITLDGWKLDNFRDLVAKVEATLPDIERTGL